MTIGLTKAARKDATHLCQVMPDGVAPAFAARLLVAVQKRAQMPIERAFGRILKKLPCPSEKINRSDLVQLLSDRFSQLTQGDSETAVSTNLQAMNSAIVGGHRIEIRGFGSFSVIHRAARMGRNPRSGAPVEIPAARVQHFKPGKALREAVDLPSKEFAPAKSQRK